MRHLGKRAWAVLTMGLLIVPMSAASLAYACTGLATISSSPGSAVAGETVTINARGFAPHDPSDSRTGSPAEIRMDSMDGPVIGTASPSASGTGGSFSVQIKVPQVEPGEHVLIATQNRNDGRPSYGTPARTVFTVNPTPAPAAAGVQAAAPAPAPQAAAPTPAPPTTKAAPTQAAPKVPQPNSRKTLARAVKRCTTKYDVKKAKTRVGKKRTAARRAACIKQAKRRA